MFLTMMMFNHPCFKSILYIDKTFGNQCNTRYKIISYKPCVLLLVATFLTIVSFKV